jgi:phage tail-like protein
VALAAFRKNIRIELMNEAGQVVMAFNVYRCWPSQYVALDELDARAPGSMTVEALTLQCEGWERDQAVVEPVEPSF